MDEFLVRALVGGIGVAIICGPLGCLVVWQRMSYFGAALSHAALLGIALGLYFEINLYLSILLICIIVSCLMMLMNRYKDLSSDTAMGILAHGVPGARHSDAWLYARFTNGSYGLFIRRYFIH